MVRKQRRTAGATTLSSSVTDVATSWPVTDGSVFPSEGDYYVTLGAEIGLVTHRVTNTLTVIRGQCGTTAGAKNAGSAVTGIMTKEEFVQRAIEANAYKSLPHGKLLDASGTVLTSADFTIINTGTTTVNDGENGCVEMRCRTHSSNDLTGISRNNSSTDRRTTIHLCSPGLKSDSASGDRVAVMIRQQTGGSMRGLEFVPDVTWGHTTRTGYLAGPTFTFQHGTWGVQDFWVQVDVEWNAIAANEQFTWRVSPDGVHWDQVHQEDFASSSINFGVWMSNRTLVNEKVQILSWIEENL